MEVIIFESEAYYQLQREQTINFIKALKEAKLEALREANPVTDWINTTEAKQLLGVRSRSKMQQLRDTGQIVFSRQENSRIIKYSRKSILEYLNKNKHETF